MALRISDRDRQRRLAPAICFLQQMRRVSHYSDASAMIRRPICDRRQRPAEILSGQSLNFSFRFFTLLPDQIPHVPDGAMVTKQSAEDDGGEMRIERSQPPFLPEPVAGGHTPDGPDLFAAPAAFTGYGTASWLLPAHHARVVRVFAHCLATARLECMSAPRHRPFC